MDVKIGETALAFFKATNTTERPVTGTAIFNVTPELAGALLHQDRMLLLHRADACRLAPASTCR